MRRSQLSPKKPFVNSYHLNEVPLPYYNPLADPYLSGFFSSRQPQHTLRQLGLKFKPQREYDY